MPSWWLYALLSAAFAALTTLLAKAGLKGVNPDLATALRTAVILPIAWGLVFWKGAGVNSLSGIIGPGGLPGRPLLFILLSGIGTGLSWIFYFRALQAGPASVVAAVDKSSLALTVLLALLFLGEPLTFKAAAGIALILAGTLVLVL